MAADDIFWLRTIGFILTVGGLVVFGLLISILNTSLQDRLSKLKKCKRPIFVEDHHVILGWSSPIFKIVEEFQDEAEAIVLLSKREREYMRENIENYFKDIEKEIKCEIYYRTGEIDNIADLKRIKIDKAKSIIVLPEDQGPDNIENARAVRALFALSKVLNKNEDDVRENTIEKPIPVVISISDKEIVEILKKIQTKKMNLYAISSKDFLSKILAQVSLLDGLEKIYEELFSFKGNEFYIIPIEELGLSDNVCFDQIINAFPKAIPVGINLAEEKRIILNPYNSEENLYKRTLSKNDALVLLSESKNNALEILKNEISHSQKNSDSNSNTLNNIKPESRRAPKILILGKGKKVDIAKMMADYLPAGSEIHFSNHTTNNQHIDNELPSSNHISYYPIENISDINSIYNYIKSTSNKFDIVVITEDEDIAEIHDSDILLTIAAIRSHNKTSKIVAEFLDPESANLAQAHVVVISSRLISSYLVQAVTNTFRATVFEELLSPEGNELVLIPIEIFLKRKYINDKINFRNILDISIQNNSIAIGYIDPERRVFLNPDKDKLIAVNSIDKIVAIDDFKPEYSLL